MVTGGRWVEVIRFRITAGYNQGVILADRVAMPRTREPVRERARWGKTRWLT
jgi:hypothetical protein